MSLRGQQQRSSEPGAISPGLLKCPAPGSGRDGYIIASGRRNFFFCFPRFIDTLAKKASICASTIGRGIMWRDRGASDHSVQAVRRGCADAAPSI